MVYSSNYSLIVTNPYWCEHQLSPLFSFVRLSSSRRQPGEGGVRTSESFSNLSCSFHFKTSVCIFFMNSSPTAALPSCTHLRSFVFWPCKFLKKKKQACARTFFESHAGPRDNKNYKWGKKYMKRKFLWASYPYWKHIHIQYIYINVYIQMSKAKEDGHIWTLPVHMPVKKV